MTPTIFQMGYADTLDMLKVAQGTALAPYEGYSWLPPGAAAPRYDVRQGSEAAAYARDKGLGKAPPGLLRKAWSKFRSLPGKAQIGIGLGTAAMLGGGALLGMNAKKHPGSQFAEQDMNPELPAQGPGKAYRPSEEVLQRLRSQGYPV